MVKRSMYKVAVVSMAALTLAAAGCAKKPAKEDSSASTRDFREAPSSPEGAGPVRVPELKTVYFDFDRSDIRADQRPVLKANGEAILKKASEWKTVHIQGNTDERGTEEYNLALGERRAQAAFKYLVDLGVPASKIVTVSLGESQPAVPGHDESAWKMNRRDEFLVTK